MTETSIPPELAERLAFLEIGSRERRQLGQLQQKVRGSLGSVLDSFYEKLGRRPELTKFFSSPMQQQTARRRQEEHWAQLLGGELGADYLNSTRRIGDAHARIGLEPQWYIAGYALLVERLCADLVRQTVSEQSARRGFWGRSRSPAPDGDLLASQVSLIIKTAFLDMDLSLKAYMQNVDVAEQIRVEQERISSLGVLTESLADALEQMAEGDLVQEIDNGEADRSNRMSNAFRKACAGLGSIILAVRDTSGKVESRARSISDSSEDAATRIGEQVEGLQMVARTIGELTESVKSVATEASKADDTVSRCCGETVQGGEVVARTINAMGKISSSSNQISQIIGVIDDIALQTNLLALNAGVEAARAGDAGLGFGVVAQEIRALARRSATAAKEIKSLIGESLEDVERGVRLVDETGGALRSIQSSVEQLGEAVGQIASGAQAQAQRIMEINTSTTQLEAATRANSIRVQEATDSSRALAIDATDLMKLVMNFKVRERVSQEEKYVPRELKTRGAFGDQKKSGQLV